MIVWLLVAIIYVGFWQALATLTSVLVPRAATSAMIAIGAWLLVTLFGSFIFRAVAATWANPNDQVARLRAEVLLARLSPYTLYTEGTTVLLDPTERATGLVTLQQVDRAIVSNLSLGQSLSVVWPQIVGLLALSAALFALAYVAFMRQEVRA